ncbi:MAG: cobalamin-binding protein [Rhodocyclaceae bacterium]|nr:cobalamin-binding protein [Rhodocyclaceae bacterium]
MRLQSALFSAADYPIVKLLRFLFSLALAAGNAHAEMVVVDDTGVAVRLPAPAQRIVSLAPHITETLFAAGAGGRIVGTVEYSDYPAAAKSIPSVGGYAQVNLEAVVALKPDLVIGWQSGNTAAHVAKLKALGLPLYLTQPNRIEDIAHSIEDYGRLAGTEAVAAPAAREFRNRLAALKTRHATQPPVRVFYQVWKQPLTTVNGEQIISDAIRTCGGVNVFADLKGLAPNVSVEAVLASDPDAIVASGMDASRPEWLDDWRRWPQLKAVARGNLFHIAPGLIQRHTPRLLEGTRLLCEQLEAVRARRGDAIANSPRR